VPAPPADDGDPHAAELAKYSANTEGEFGSSPSVTLPPPPPPPPPPADSSSTPVDANVAKFFRQLDVDNNGMLSSRELRTALKRLDLVVTNDAAKAILKDYDSDHSLGLDLKEFASVVAKMRSLEAKHSAAIDRQGLMAAYKRDQRKQTSARRPNGPAPTWFERVQQPDTMESCPFEGKDKLRAQELEALMRSLSSKKKSGASTAAPAAAPAAVRIEAAAIFEEFDCDASGALSSRELRKALKKLGLQLTSEQAVAVLQEYDADSSRSLDPEEFNNLVARLRTASVLPLPPGSSRAAAPALPGVEAPRGLWMQGRRGNIPYDARASRVEVRSESW